MRLLCILLVTLLSRIGAAQTPDSTRPAPDVTVGGVVWDSIAGVPLAGAVVQLIAADTWSHVGRTASSDSLGRFAFSDVQAGRYQLGFLHSRLDSLGLLPPLRELHVDGPGPVHADLAIPSPARLRVAICGVESPGSGAVVVGVVRNAEDREPAVGVRVTALWLELTVNRQGFLRRMPSVDATTDANGWFALCEVPRAGTIALLASRGEDSTDLIDVQIPAEGFVRRDLYLGPARTVITGDIAGLADTLAGSPGFRREGDGRLSGMVITTMGGGPLADAHVGIPLGPSTRTNDEGEWTLAGAPLGTRILEVRAIGHYPERRAVDVVAGAAPMVITLSTMREVLDTVRVTASRLYDPDGGGFAQRRRSGAGRYLTPEDIARRRPIVTSDLFRMLPGLRVERGPMGETRVEMRGMFANRCSPAVYVDGHHMVGWSADDIDSWVPPDEIAGVEVYSSAVSAPPQFRPGLSTCGSIVIWTDPVAVAVNRLPWKKRIVRLLGAVAASILVGTLLGQL